MYHTSNGNRTLHGPEARLFRIALRVAVDRVHDFEIDGFGFDIPIFISLTHNSKLAMLEQVGSALLIDETPPPQLSAVLEATVATAFFVLRDILYVEIDASLDNLEHETDIRQALLDVANQDDDTEELPIVDSCDHNKWYLVFENIMDSILWDEDWLEGDINLDLPLEATHSKMKLMGIAPLYYSAIAPDPTDEMMPEVIERLQKLTRYSE